MNGITIILWIIIFVVGAVAILFVKSHFKEGKLENSEKSMISKERITNFISNRNNIEPKTSLHKDSSHHNQNRFISQTEAYAQEDYSISYAPEVENNNNKNTEYESQNQILINYENEVKKTQEPMNDYQVEIMTQDNEKHELKDLFTIDELIKESKRKDSEREKEAQQVKGEDDKELTELKESIKKQKEAKEVDDKLIDEILADEEIGKILESDSVEETAEETPAEETIADIINTEKPPAEETIADIINTEEPADESVQDVLDVETPEESTKEVSADIKEETETPEIENQSVATQKDIEEAINTASQEIEEKEIESISERENITDALLNSEEEIKEPVLKSPTKISETESVETPIDDSYLSSDEPANELDYRNDLNKIKNTIRGSKLFQDVKEKLRPETPEYEPINDLEETYIRNVNEYEDEYAPIINETHDEFGEYYEPDYDEAIRQENTRKLFETTTITPEKPKIEKTEPKANVIKSKPSRDNIKIQIGNTEVVLKKGDEIIFKHDGETYSSQVYAINGDEISVRYRRKDIKIKPEDVKKVY